jgi:hypothetical protein
MGLIEHAPVFGCETKGVLRTLEDKVAILGPVAGMSESSK